MKLLVCLNCQDVFKLPRVDSEPRTCQCGRVTGQYKRGGDECWHNGRGVLLAIRNDEFRRMLGQNKLMTSTEAEGPVVFMYRDDRGKVEIRPPVVEPLTSGVGR